MDIRPPFLCRLLLRPALTRCRCQGESLLLETRNGDTTVPLRSVVNAQFRGLGPLASLSLEVRDTDPVELGGLWKGDVVRLWSICQDARRREQARCAAQLDALRDKFRQVLVGRWDAYPQAMMAWRVALSTIAATDPDAVALSWLRANGTLPLPKGPDDVCPGTIARPPLPVAAADPPAHESPEATDLRERMERFLGSALPRYDRAMAAWKAAFGPGLYLPESSRARCLRPHENLPRLHDLDPTVNGRRVKVAELSDGDEVRAGQTVFRLSITQDDGCPTTAAHPFWAPAAPYGGPGQFHPLVLGQDLRTLAG